MEGGIEVPSYFVCPISLEIMRDPVTIPTGITYDRGSIEKWIFSGNHHVCPVTKQPLVAGDVITPNHTLRRLIQAWCVANACNGVERFPTPRPPVGAAGIAALLEEARLPGKQASALRKLKAVVLESDRNRRCIEAAGAVDVLASILEKSVSVSQEEEEEAASAGACTVDEVLAILCSLQLSEKSLLELAQRDGDFVELLTEVLGRRSSGSSRCYSLQLLKSLLPVIAPSRLLSLTDEFVDVVTRALRDRISYEATKAALQVVCLVSSWGKNRSKAVQAGAVRVLVELLQDETERRTCEMMLAVLERLCGCAEGRAELVGHAAGIAVVGKKLQWVSPLASRTAVKILYSVARASLPAEVLQEMLESGVVAKLCQLLRTESDEKVRERIGQMLRWHSKAWRKSARFPPQFKSSYHPLHEYGGGMPRKFFY